MKRFKKDTGFLAVLGLSIMSLVAVLLSSYGMYRYAVSHMSNALNERTLQAVQEAERVFREEAADNRQGRLESIRRASKLESLFLFDLNRRSLLDANSNVVPGKLYTYLQLPHQVDISLKKGETYIGDKKKEYLFRTRADPLIVEGKILGGVYADAGIDYKKSLNHLRKNWILATVFTGTTTMILSIILFGLYRRSEQLHENMHRYSRLELIHLLSAGIAHDIKNPLAVITSSAESLQDRIVSKDKLSHRYIDFIRNGSAQVLEITENLLGSSKSMEPEEIEIKPFLEFIIKKFQPMVVSRGIRLKIDLEDAGKACVSATPLRMTFSNVLHNAIEAVDEKHGRVHVGVQRISGYLGIAISDNGQGISPRMQKKIFNPLVTTKKGGSGLGLPVARQLLEDMHGELEVRSRVGKGTTFVLWLSDKLTTGLNE